MELISLAGLLVLLALIAAPILFAFCIVGVVLKLVFFVLFLPFRLLGAVIGVGVSSVGWLVKSVLIFAGIGFLLLLGALPILPFLLIACGLYLVFRAMRPRPPVSTSPGR